MILLVSAWGMGGTIRAALNLAGYLAKEHDVEIISVFRKRQKPFFGEFPEGVKVTALDDRRPKARPRGLHGLLYRVLSGTRSVLVHPADRYAQDYFSLWTDVQLIRALRRGSGVLMATRPGLNLIAAELALPGFKTIGLEQMHLHHHVRRLRRAMRREYPQLDAFVVLTERDRREYEQLLEGRGRIEVIPNTVRDLGATPADLDSRTIFAAGRLVDQKGFDMLIEAFAPVAEKHPDWRLKICGHGARRPDLERQIEELGLGHVVELAPPAKQIGEEMSKASIFALSSRFEGFPLILLEAMSAHMPVVAFDCPTGPGEIVENRRNGILVPAEDVAAFSDGLLQFIEDAELRATCATAAAVTAHEFTMEAVGSRWDALIDDLTGRRPPAAAEPQVDEPPSTAGVASR